MVEHLVRRHTVPYTSDVLGKLIYVIIAARRHTASRLLEQLAYLGSMDTSTADTLLAMTTSLQNMYAEGFYS